jgi:hypothetical protein
VAVILAIGLSSAVNLLLFGVVYDAVFRQDSGLSENATQVIIAAFTGITGVLGGYIGGRAVERAQERREEAANGRQSGAEDPQPPQGPPAV